MTLLLPDGVAERGDLGANLIAPPVPVKVNKAVEWH
jgi:hypothetical protein